MVPIFVRFPVSILLGLLIPLALSGQTAAAGAPVRLRAGDGVRLEVQDEPDMAAEYQIDDGGRALLPQIGVVMIAGRDFEEVRREVEARYARELAHRAVLIVPLLRIAVLGEVTKPGLYPVDPTMTLGDVVALAGGLGPEANRNRIEVVREGRVVAVANQQDVASLHRALASGDQIVVARRGWIRSNSAALLGVAGSLVVAVFTSLLLR